MGSAVNSDPWSALSGKLSLDVSDVMYCTLVLGDECSRGLGDEDWREMEKEWRRKSYTILVEIRSRDAGFSKNV
jgi:hypothetical protein